MALLYDYHYSSNEFGEINIKGLCSQEGQNLMKKQIFSITIYMKIVLKLVPGNFLKIELDCLKISNILYSTNF